LEKHAGSSEFQVLQEVHITKKIARNHLEHTFLAKYQHRKYQYQLIKDS